MKYIKRYLRRKLKAINKRRYEKEHKVYFDIYENFRSYTMIERQTYIHNITLVERFKHISGAVVECGTWRGGMIAGIAKLFGDNRSYYLFDSFEGLPEAKQVDGEGAINWQKDTSSKGYYDNCTAEEATAREAMQLAGATNVHIHKGWFAETLPHYNKQPIAILRLDGDWYESTMDCLVNLYDSVVPGGVIILDDYFTWDGCTRAVHDFLSKNGLSDKVRQWHDDRIAYIIKEGTQCKNNNP